LCFNVLTRLLQHVHDLGPFADSKVADSGPRRAPQPPESREFGDIPTPERDSGQLTNTSRDFETHFRLPRRKSKTDLLVNDTRKSGSNSLGGSGRDRSSAGSRLSAVSGRRRIAQKTLSHPDGDVLRIAADAGRVLVSRDVRTMPGHLEKFVSQNPSPGLLLIPSSRPIGW